jgi:hypothetical protein
MPFLAETGSNLTSCDDAELANLPAPAVAAAAAAGVPTLTLICLGFASSRLGTTSVKTPFCQSAFIHIDQHMTAL